MTVRAKVTRNAFASTKEICAKKRGGGGVKGREGERNRLSIVTEMDPLWLIKQVETFEQTGARKARNIYTKGLFNVSHRCYQGPLHLRLHMHTTVQKSQCLAKGYLYRVYINHRMPVSRFLKKIIRKNGLATVCILFKRRPILA